MANKHSHRYEWTFRFIHILCSWKSHNVKRNDGNSRSSLLDVRIVSRAPHLLRQLGNTIVFFSCSALPWRCFRYWMAIPCNLLHSCAMQTVKNVYALHSLALERLCVRARPCTFIVSQVIKQFNIFPLSIRYTHFFPLVFRSSFRALSTLWLPDAAQRCTNERRMLCSNMTATGDDSSGRSSEPSERSWPLKLHIRSHTTREHGAHDTHSLAHPYNSSYCWRTDELQIREGIVMAFLVTLCHASLHGHRPFYSKGLSHRYISSPLHSDGGNSGGSSTCQIVWKGARNSHAYHNDVRFGSFCSFISYLPSNMRNDPAPTLTFPKNAHRIRIFLWDSVVITACAVSLSSSRYR